MSGDTGTDVLDLLGDEYVRTILVEARGEPKSVDALSDACSADPSTIYRRVERLREAGLLVDHQRLDPGGHHYKEYTTAPRTVTLRIDPDGYEVELDESADEKPADRFTRLYEGFK